MITLIVTSCLQMQLVDTSGWWMYQKPSVVDSDRWNIIKIETAREVDRLKTESKSSRSTKFAQLLERFSNNPQSEREAYRTGAFIIAFESELTKGATGGSLRALVRSSKGTNNQEFQRICYTALSLSQSPGDWNGLGRQLLKIFPNDAVLFRAFVYDCYSRNSADADLREARARLETTIMKSFTTEEKWKMHAAIYEKSYWLSKSQDHLTKAIKFLENYIEHCSDNGKKTVAQDRVRLLKSRLV